MAEGDAGRSAPSSQPHASVALARADRRELKGAKIAWVTPSEPSRASIRLYSARPAAVRISARSSLVLDGDITLESLSLDGAAVLRAAPGAHVLVRDARARACTPRPRS